MLARSPFNLIDVHHDKDSGFDFHLPKALEAGEPPEARGLARDQVRLLVSHYQDDRITHAKFRDLPDYLNPGDVLVINTSGTRKAALDIAASDGEVLELHLSTHLPADLWIVELRKPDGSGTKPFFEARPGEILSLPGGGVARLHVPYDPDLRGASREAKARVRLWVASLELPSPVEEYLYTYGFPIRYPYVHEKWPIDYYQNVYTTEIGSAEIPSAGRPFTPQLITRLVSRGVLVAPLLLHAGVASLERDELPHEEYFNVPVETAEIVTRARMQSRRVVGVGTTVVRALETVTDERGITSPGKGWTKLVIDSTDKLRSINALLTGFHEPRATHLALLAALAGIDHLKLAYLEALSQGYLWHEFGDLHLILE